MTDDPPTDTPSPFLGARSLVLILVGVAVGLAPWTPEPHLVEKWRWWTAAHGLGMTWLDVFDGFFHVAWLLLAAILVLRELYARIYAIR